MSDIVNESAASGSKGQRRFWPADLKRQIVAESFEPGASVAIVARQHGINTNLLFTWRHRFGAESSARRAEPVKWYRWRLRRKIRRPFYLLHRKSAAPAKIGAGNRLSTALAIAEQMAKRASLRRIRLKSPPR